MLTVEMTLTHYDNEVTPQVFLKTAQDSFEVELREAGNIRYQRYFADQLAWLTKVEGACVTIQVHERGINVYVEFKVVAAAGACVLDALLTRLGAYGEDIEF